MPLEPGQKLSHYRLVEKIGEGGMGVVWKARDEKLRRDVALKVLPAELVEDPERRRRLLGEARTAAAVNHPNIAMVHEVDEADGIVFIAMELVEGKTLRSLFGGKPLAIPEALRIATEIAGGLVAAHQVGVIHRDLKPENVLVRPDGVVKILDFGLAKLHEEPRFDDSQPSQVETITQLMTKEGRILGTPAYMSPEQAKGEAVDARSDLFSFGSMLYEMVTGQAPFQGNNTTEILSAILRDRPSAPSVQGSGVPTELDWIVGKCLEKDPAGRYQATSELAVDLDRLARGLVSGGFPLVRPLSQPAHEAAATPRSRSTLFLFVAIAAAVVVAGSLWMISRLAPREEPTVIPRTLQQLTSRAGEELFPSLSPDGRHVVYASSFGGDLDLYLHRVGGQRAINLTEDSDADDSQPAYSADGDRIAFRSERDGGGIFIMGATGESVRRVTEFGYNPAWSPDGTQLVFGTDDVQDPVSVGQGELWTVDIASGRTTQIRLAGAAQPSWSPNGHRIAFFGQEGGRRDIWTTPPDGTELVQVSDDAAVDWSPAWSPDGRYLYFLSDRGGTMSVWRVPIDERSGKVLGEMEAITTGTSMTRNLSIARGTGRLAYVVTATDANLWKVAFDPDTELVEGSPVPITSGTIEFDIGSPSPDGKWIACWRYNGSQEDVFAVRVDGTEQRQLTDDIHKDRNMRWSPDGKRIAFYSNRTGGYAIWTMNADGGDLQQRTEFGSFLPVWSPDGRRFAFLDIDEGTFIVGLSEGEETPKRQRLPSIEDLAEKDTLLTFPGVLVPQGDYFMADDWSPDGRWLAGIRNGREGVILFSLEDESYRQLLEFGYEPQWLADSRRILYRSEDTLFIADAQSGEYREIFTSRPQAALGATTISRDNRWIFFTRIANESDIWILSPS